MVTVLRQSRITHDELVEHFGVQSIQDDPSFFPECETNFGLSDELEDDVVLRGQLDTVLIKHGFWVMAIESKRPTYSIEAGLPQLISYLLANPNGDLPCYGMITTDG